VAALTPQAEIDGNMGDSHMGLQARLMSQAMRKLTGALSQSKTLCIFTNQVREKIGFLTSELKPDEFFTPSYLFDFFSELQNIPTQVRDERKKELFDRFGIAEFCETKVGELSTGMKQKVSIAISLVHDPDVIIFDEPTNGLDVLTAKVVTDFLLELKARGKTILLSTHIFSLVEKICDRVGVIIDGKMALEGEVKALTAEKSLEDVFFDLYKEIREAKE
jgi:sodium transport system ATP-binding protein